MVAVNSMYPISILVFTRVAITSQKELMPGIPDPCICHCARSTHIHVHIVTPSLFTVFHAISCPYRLHDFTTIITTPPPPPSVLWHWCVDSLYQKKKIYISIFKKYNIKKKTHFEKPGTNWMYLSFLASGMPWWRWRQIDISREVLTPRCPCFHLVIAVNDMTSKQV